MQILSGTKPTVATLARTSLATRSTTKSLQERHPAALGLLRLDYLRKAFLYSLLCLLMKALTANPCFGFAIQYCHLRAPNALLVIAKAFRCTKATEALFVSFA
ncbi:hypothetical protein PHYBOEH_004821 [Phytophthora boehmeriae]|uniref:Uncharacterized protein n=1 Tax=Phytophthora boehmeriae TaxID=109152 RepID=A0A8T1WLB5_9STRA|nr:hypothetical protein PHYBOEH_004821 [Phytophthora boehmeriae]